ncbi:hypothetical protein [Psychrobacter celer]|uniref:hypothetical protein n=1 Tax=Psychrobacter celer TaxID=306572 RepID=UPI003FD45E4E
MIKLYVYDKHDKHLLYEDTGLPEFVITDLPPDADFTLTPPPNTHEKWYWIDNKWVADETAS